MTCIRQGFTCVVSNVIRGGILYHSPLISAPPTRLWVQTGMSVTNRREGGNTYSLGMIHCYQDPMLQSSIDTTSSLFFLQGLHKLIQKVISSVCWHTLQKIHHMKCLKGHMLFQVVEETHQLVMGHSAWRW